MKHFVPGHTYDIGTSLGTLMLAEGWAEPIENEAAAETVGGDPFTSRVPEISSPPNLIRETHPPAADGISLATDFERRKRARLSSRRR